MGGLRYQYVHSTNTRAWRRYGVHPRTLPQTDDAVTPRVGLLWQPQNWLSLYSNYAENFGANTGAFAFGGIDARAILARQTLTPQSAQQWEVGAKTEFFDGRLRATLAYFDLTKQNVATTDTAHPTECGGGGCSSRSRRGPQQGAGTGYSGRNPAGLERDCHLRQPGCPRHQKSMAGTDSGVGFEVGNRLQFVPRNIGSVWSTYEVQQGPLDGFKIGGGVNMQDGVVNADNTIKSTGYALVGLMTGYSFEVGKSKITAQLNVDNLLDKSYFTNGV